MLTRADAAVEVTWHLIDHAAHGYSQPHRSGNNTTETIKLSDGELVNVHGGDYDCSELIKEVWVAVGVLPKGAYMWTGNEREQLVSHGFYEVPVREARKGDVLWRSSHTEMHLGDNLQGGARISERGTIDGVEGDQTGGEITYSTFRPNAWSRAFRYTKDVSGIVQAGIPVDGYWGKQTTTALQKALGTTQDGIVSNQNSYYRGRNPGLITSSWEFVTHPTIGSQVIRALQQKIGVNASGIADTQTFKRLQTYLGTPTDGFISAPSMCVRELQRRLNAGTF